MTEKEISQKPTPGPWLADIRIDDGYSKSSEIYSREESEIQEPICIVPHDDITEEGEQEVIANIALLTNAYQLPELESQLTALTAERDKYKRKIRVALDQLGAMRKELNAAHMKTAKAKPGVDIAVIPRQAIGDRDE